MTDTPCATAILELLTLYPDCEMRAQDVFGELDEKWPLADVQASLDVLLAARRVLRITDAGVQWYCVAMEKLNVEE